MGQTEQPVLEGGERPWCPRHGVTPVSAVGPHSGYSPWDGFWDAGPQAFGTLMLPQGLGWSDAESWGAPGSPLRPSEQSTREWASYRGACTWTQHRGYNHEGSARSYAHSGHDRARPTRAPAPSHPRVDTLPTCTYPRLTEAPGCTEPFRATRCLTEPHGALPDLTEPRGCGAVRCPRARPFIHSPTRAVGTSRARRGREAQPRAGPAPPRAHE